MEKDVELRIALEEPAIEALLDEDQKDELHEYLRIFFKDGSIMLFRNSHVSLFVLPQRR